MIIFKQKKDMQQHLALQKAAGATIGFVPTMGALHQGHISLITTAKQQCSIVVCSIFVNPTQFNNPQDFEKYPITIDADVYLLETNVCDILYLPSVADIYDTGVHNLQHYPLGFIETVYDGAFRPGHFQGVCNVVERLFRAVEPTKAFFGLKDYQQCMVITKLVTLMNWQQKLSLVLCPTLRETDGLAMSSRNMRLSDAQRSTAPIIYQTLLYIKKHVTASNLLETMRTAKQMLEQQGLVPDYIDIADAKELSPVTTWDGKQAIVCLVAAFLGDVRLIDNMIIHE